MIRYFPVIWFNRAKASSLKRTCGYADNPSQSLANEFWEPSSPNTLTTGSPAVLGEARFSWSFGEAVRLIEETDSAIFEVTLSIFRTGQGLARFERGAWFPLLQSNRSAARVFSFSRAAFFVLFFRL